MDSPNPLRISLNGYDNPADVVSPSSQMAVKFSLNNENITEFDATKLRPVSRWQAKFTFM